ncbi:hypothetical protein BH20ACT4_BH20ACT4_01930 [soil metagenome]
MTLAVRTFRGSPGEHHQLAVAEPAAPQLWVFDADRPAVVLGSRQELTVADSAACALAGMEVVRRRSGGGAVLVEPGAMTWVDVIVPAGDRRWTDDVVASMRWCGERWLRALTAIGAGAAGSFDVCPSSTAPTGVSDLVCFAGLAAGEVTSGGDKLVGISQRRTRHAARFQCAVHHVWRPLRLWAMLAAPRPGADVFEALPVAVIDRAVRPALVDALACEFST